jgi:beta-lactamase superfamily II metal-dependent hydrolase
MKDPVATVYFLDVGQGSAQVIVFEDQTIFIIDCGRDSLPLIDLLKKIERDSGLKENSLRITGLVLSHYHQDHIGGAYQILKTFAKRIDHVFLPQDRSTADILSRQIVRKIIKDSEKPNSFTLSPLIYNGVDCGIIHPPRGQTLRASLSIMYPNIAQSWLAQVQADPNQGSGIMLLKCGDCRILFPGDAGKMAFETMEAKLKSKLPCEILTAPHHGGKLSKKEESYEGYANAYSWLFGKILQSKITIFSVGTSNDHDHPRPEHVQAVVASGSKVICTQITKQCHSNPSSLGQSLTIIDEPSACQHKGIGCAGTIVAFLDENEATIQKWDTHQEEVTKLSKSKGCQPLCRRSP